MLVYVSSSSLPSPQQEFAGVCCSSHMSNTRGNSSIRQPIHETTTNIFLFLNLFLLFKWVDSPIKHEFCMKIFHGLSIFLLIWAVMQPMFANLCAQFGTKKENSATSVMYLKFIEILASCSWEAADLQTPSAETEMLITVSCSSGRNSTNSYSCKPQHTTFMAEIFIVCYWCLSCLVTIKYLYF